MQQKGTAQLAAQSLLFKIHFRKRQIYLVNFQSFNYYDTDDLSKMKWQNSIESQN